jgi:hypothetical protein
LESVLSWEASGFFSSGSLASSPLSFIILFLCFSFWI